MSEPAVNSQIKDAVQTSTNWAMGFAPLDAGTPSSASRVSAGGAIAYDKATQAAALAVQDAAEQVLSGGMRLMNAKGAAAVLMDVHSGEVISLVSLPDFDPNDRPRPPTKGHAADSPLFNRAVQGVYELGSTFKIFAAAQAMELGLINPVTAIDTRGPLRWGKHRIRDFHNYGKELTTTQVIVTITAVFVAFSLGMAAMAEAGDWTTSASKPKWAPMFIPCATSACGVAHCICIAARAIEASDRVQFVEEKKTKQLSTANLELKKQKSQLEDKLAGLIAAADANEAHELAIIEEALATWLEPVRHATHERQPRHTPDASPRRP